MVFNSNVSIKLANLDEALLGKNLSSAKNENSISFNKPSDIKPLKVVEKELREKYFKFVRDNSISDAEAAMKLGLAPPNFHRMCKELGIK